MNRFFFSISLISVLFLSCQPMKQIPLEPGVSQKLAVDRAARIQNLVYELHFNLPDSVQAPIPAHLTIRLELKSTTHPLILDFREEPDHLLKLEIGEREIPLDFREGHLVIAPKYLHKGENEIRIGFIAGDLSLNRNEDYLYTLLVPDRASTAFPCFDQPDLKARYRLHLELPAAWEAAGNGALTEVQLENGRKKLSFRETQPFSTYVFAFAAGRLRKQTQSRAGREMTMYFRETDDEKIARNADTIFDLHAEAIRWMEEYTRIPFPFDKLDFVLLPGFQYGGMEHIGNIFYREASLMLDESATENQKLGRARLIAHETAHMWFGDMVTMRWFNDVWLKEVFANFMAAKAVNPAFPHINHDLSFMLSHQPTAFAEDRSGGSHPVQQVLENMKDAGSLYGGIIYQKAPVVMRQLEALMGEAPFRQGLQQYLKTFAYGNATWDDLISILDALSDRDLREWSQVWVKEAGMPVLRTECAVLHGKLQSVRIIQEKSSASGQYWIQNTTLALVYPDSILKIPVRIEGPVTEIDTPDGLPAPLATLANGSSMSYGYFKLDDASREYGLKGFHAISDPLLRGAAWMALYEELVNGRIDSPRFMRSILQALPLETEPLNRQNLLGYLSTIYWRFYRPAQRLKAAEEIERILWDLLSHARDIGGRSAYFSAFSNIALTEEGVDRLFQLWDGTRSVPGLPLSESQKIGLASEIALRRPAQAGEILDRQLERTQNPDRRKRLAFIRPALAADSSVRDAFFQSLKDPANREVEPWVVDAADFLNHPLRAGESEKYILPSLELLEEIQRTGDIFFPRQFISAVLGGHQSAEAGAIVRQFLEKNPAFPYRLRNKVLMAADMLFRVSED